MIIEVHSKEGCPKCVEAKAWLTARHHAFTEIRHDDDAERSVFYDTLNLTGNERTMPQIIICAEGERIRVAGGCDGLPISGL